MADTLPLRDPSAAPPPAVEALHDHAAAGRPAPPAAAVEPLLLPADQAARLCGVSEASWYRLKSAGKVPAAVKLGGRVLWRIEDLRLFVSWGCPDRKTFEARKGAENASGRRGTAAGR